MHASASPEPECGHERGDDLSARAVEQGAIEGACAHEAVPSWRELRSNPDYVADWRANAGPVALEAPPFPLRRQTEADLEAARWDLLAWEAPWLKGHGAPFWAEVTMIEGRALDVGDCTGRTLRRVVVRPGVTFWGLWLRGGALVLKVFQGRESVQISVADGEAFTPARSGLAIAVRSDTSRRRSWVRVERLDGTIFAR